VKVVPPLAAVPPVDRLIFSPLAAWPGLLMNALAVTDRPGATPSTKYEPAFPLLPLAGISPTGWLRPLAATAGRAEARMLSIARTAAAARIRLIGRAISNATADQPPAGQRQLTNIFNH
jgi:hypothetical protein